MIGQLFLIGLPFQESEPLIANQEPEGPVAYLMLPPKGMATAATEDMRQSGSPKTQTPSMAFRGYTPHRGDNPETHAPSMAFSGYTPHRGDKLRAPYVELKKFAFNGDQAFNQLVFDFSGPFNFTKVNQGGKFLRLRIQPAIAVFPKSIQKVIAGELQSFSCLPGNLYSEWIIYGKGALGEPFSATSAENLPQLVIPCREEVGFPLSGGEKLEEGLWYYTDRPSTKSGPSDVFIIRVDSWSPGLSVFPALANEGICQKEILSRMGTRYNAVAALNGTYFNHRGDPIGTLIIQKKLISSPLYDRSVFGITDRGRPLFGNPDFSGKLAFNDLTLEIDAVNQPRTGDKLVIYTPEFARSTLTEEGGVELVLVKNRVVGVHESDALIPPDGVVVSGGGKKAALLDHLRLGDMVSLNYQVSQPWDRIQHAVCGGPRLLSDGEKSINGEEERFDSTIVIGRHPRSAAALLRDGEILFVVVDGRSKRSAGMTLSELADYLKGLGARNAINLDGGGSSSMFIRGKIVNQPSDGKERPISNGILITKK